MSIPRRRFLKMMLGAAATLTAGKVFGLTGTNLEVVSNPYAYPPEYRGWEDLYRDEWTWDSVSRSTHGVNCTGSCSWMVYEKGGLILREEQAADYPEIDPALPSVNPRGCNKGACYSAEYVNGDRRIKYPLKRVAGTARGAGQWQQISWDQALTEIADQVIATIQDHGQDALTFFTPIPAMSPVSFSSGVRLAHLLGGVVCSFYDWYCDLPPGSPITLGEQTDVAEATDWVNAKYMILWGSNPVLTRIPDAHFVTEAKYRGCKVLAIYPDYAASSIRADRWLSVNPGTDAALALAICQRLIATGQYDAAYLQEQTDMPLLVRTDTGEYLREADVFAGGSPDQFYFWDAGLQPAPMASLDLGGLSPDLSGSHLVDLDGGAQVTVETVFDRLTARLNANHTVAQAAAVTGVGAAVITGIADEIGAAGISSGGQVMIMHGAGTNHWYHNDLNNRAMLLMLSLVGAIGKNGGGFNHYVGQEKIWPVNGLKALSFPQGGGAQRFQNTTVWAHVHAELEDQPTGLSQTTRGYIFDSVANGWMPLHPEGALGTDKNSFVNNGVPLRDPKMMFIWRANWFNQAKGNNYIEQSLYPKLDMIVDLNFHMDTTALYADYVLPSASHYEKYDINTTDMHSFCHPFTPAIPPMFDSKSDWQIFQALAAKIQERANGYSYPDPKWPGGIRYLSSLLNDFTNNGAIAADIDATQFLLDHAPETVGMTVAGITAQPQRFNNTTTWTSNLEAGRPYTAFLKNTEDKDPYHTLTGRQQYLIEHEWFVEAGEDLPTYKPPVVAAGEEAYPLLYNTPHGRWAIHSTWRNAKQMLRLNRGGPICYMHPTDMTSRGLVDNDWVRMFNNHGQVIIRVKEMPSEKTGRVTMYHSWERYVGVKEQLANFNSVTGIRIKPTQLAGGYGQLHFALNYWGPTGVQRDTRVEVEKYNG